MVRIDGVDYVGAALGTADSSGGVSLYVPLHHEKLGLTESFAQIMIYLRFADNSVASLLRELCVRTVCVFHLTFPTTSLISSDNPSAPVTQAIVATRER